MINGSTVCSSFKLGLFNGSHNFSQDIFYIALYDDSANIDADTTAYVTEGEISGPGYVAGGVALANAQILGPANGVAYVTFDDPVWPGSSLTARGALIYNFTNSQLSVAVLDFGGDKTSNNGDFRIKFPPPGSTTALIRIM